jgi:hypothetical protein
MIPVTLDASRTGPRIDVVAALKAIKLTVIGVRP